FADDNKVLAVGDNGNILFSNNSGSNWTQMSLGTSDTLSSIDFVNQNIAFLTSYNGNNSKIWKSVNGGLNWTVEANINSSKLYSISFVDGNTGFSSGSDFSVYK